MKYFSDVHLLHCSNTDSDLPFISTSRSTSAILTNTISSNNCLSSYSDKCHQLDNDYRTPFASSDFLLQGNGSCSSDKQKFLLNTRRKKPLDVDEDFDIMDIEMRRLEEKLKMFEDELGILSARNDTEESSKEKVENFIDNPSVEVIVASSTFPLPEDVFHSISLPKVYPPVSLLKTKHLSLTKPNKICLDDDYPEHGLNSLIESKCSVEKLILKRNNRAKRKRRHHSLDIQKLLKNEVFRNDIEIKEQDSNTLKNIPISSYADLSHTELADLPSRKCVDSILDNYFTSSSDFGFLWYDEITNMSHLSFEALEQFSDAEIENSLFFIFEDDDDDDLTEEDQNIFCTSDQKQDDHFFDSSLEYSTINEKLLDEGILSNRYSDLYEHFQSISQVMSKESEKIDSIIMASFSSGNPERNSNDERYSSFTDRNDSSIQIFPVTSSNSSNPIKSSEHSILTSKSKQVENSELYVLDF